ncbi:GatB/YqeY domain-containing protein [Patescibacteria group bacterium]|nr:GatB/YqeY domain-containing protein [Patescibacteria group bacterium]
MVLVTLIDQIDADLKAAMKAKTEPNRTVLRSLVAALKNEQIATGGDLDEAKQVAVVQKQLKQREEAAAALESRPEMAQNEQAEATIIKKYLPEMMSEADVKAAVTDAIKETGASGPAQIGQIMGALKGKLAGKADMGAVSAEVKRQLE